MPDFYVEAGEFQFGPLSASDIKELAAAGKISPKHHVRKGEEGKWHPASELKGLVFGKPVPPSTVIEDLPDAAAGPQRLVSRWLRAKIDSMSPNERAAATTALALWEANWRRLACGLTAGAMLLGGFVFARYLPWAAVSVGLFVAICAVACFAGAKEGLWKPYSDAAVGRQRLVAAVAVVCGFLLMAFTSPAFQERSRIVAHAAQVRAANEAVVHAVRLAQASFLASQYDDAEQELTAATSNDLATEVSAAQDLLAQVRHARDESRARQKKRDDDAAALEAERVSRALWQSVELAIHRSDFADANRLVSSYVAHPTTTLDRDRATAAINALGVITSPDRAVVVLDGLTDAEFADFKERGNLPASAAIDEPLLSVAYNNAIHAQVPAVERLRQERVAKQKAEAKRVASEKRKRELDDQKLAAAKAAAAKAPPTQPKDRYSRVLRSDDGSPMAVCVDEKVFDRFTKACVREDATLVSQMVSGNLVWEVASGTRVRLTDPGFFSSEVEIREGKHAGKRGIVANDFLKD